MNCFMFPGQPLSLASMPDDPAFVETARSCQVATGFNPLVPESAPQLTDSVKLQLSGTTMSLYRTDLLTLQHGSPGIIAEHSMGIYPALAACGSIDPATAVELTCRIGVCLASMGKGHTFAMGSVVGLTYNLLHSVAANNHVYIANYNTSRHFILAGDSDRIREAAAEAEAVGAFSTSVFPTDAPLHTPLVNAVASTLRDIVSDYTFRRPQIPLMDHLEQRKLNASDIPCFLVEELCRPVFWEKTCRALKSEGVKKYFEAGAGSALTKFNRWIDSEL